MERTARKFLPASLSRASLIHTHTVIGWWVEPFSRDTGGTKNVVDLKYCVSLTSPDCYFPEQISAIPIVCLLSVEGVPCLLVVGRVLRGWLRLTVHIFRFLNNQNKDCWFVPAFRVNCEVVELGLSFWN